MLYRRLRLAALIDSVSGITFGLDIVAKVPGNSGRFFFPSKFSGNDSSLRSRSKHSWVKCKWQIRKSLSSGGRFVLLEKCFNLDANNLS